MISRVIWVEWLCILYRSATFYIQYSSHKADKQYICCLISCDILVSLSRLSLMFDCTKSLCSMSRNCNSKYCGFAKYLFFLARVAFSSAVVTLMFHLMHASSLNKLSSMWSCVKRSNACGHSFDIRCRCFRNISFDKNNSICNRF